MRVRLQCGFCAETFVHIGPEFPDECPLCHAYVGLDGKPEVAAPFISLKGAKAPDDLYRSMERSAEHRMNMAAEVTGQPVADFASMKMTNMKDGLREGDTTFVAPSLPASGVTGNFGGAVDPRALQGVQTGPSPRAGAGMMPKIRELHSKYAPVTDLGSMKFGQG